MKYFTTLLGSFLLGSSSLLVSVDAWAPSVRHVTAAVTSKKTTGLSARRWDLEESTNSKGTFDPMGLSKDGSKEEGSPFPFHRASLLGALALTTPGIAEAAAPGVLPSALAAYGHYLSILVITASIMTERLTVKPAMSIEEENLLGYADIMTGIAGVGVLISGYHRAVDYGKGWDFYSHEPIFWLKMTFLGIFGGLSLFPTITIIQRTVKIRQEGQIEPMSEELANRMKKVLNAELTALASIPLTATLMARGVGYVTDFPTETVGPAFFAVVTGGAVFKYVKDALTWKEPTVDSAE